MNAKYLTDRNGKAIVKGTIVSYQKGHRRVVSVYIGSQTVNIASIFGSKITAKRVPLAEVFDDEAAWHEAWTKSEAYQCM